MIYTEEYLRMLKNAARDAVEYEHEINKKFYKYEIDNDEEEEDA